MPLKKSDLYASLWASCDELRGSMDAQRFGYEVCGEIQAGSSPTITAMFRAAR